MDTKATASMIRNVIADLESFCIQNGLQETKSVLQTIPGYLEIDIVRLEKESNILQLTMN